MLRKRLIPTFLILITVLLMLTACSEPETIQVIITPTPDPNRPTETLTPTDVPTETSTYTNTPLIPTATMTETEIPPTVTETLLLSQTPTPPEPTQVFRGPITQPDYVLPTIPTNTPEPVTLQPVSPTPAVVTPGPSPTPIPGLNPSVMGIQIYSNLDYTDFQTGAGLAAATGVEWIKIQVNWAYLQPDGPNDLNDRMQLFEQQVELASRPPDMKVLLSIAKAPNWARSNQQEDGPPDDPQALAEFITFMLTTKIGESIDAIEVWNEPNLIREWRGGLEFSGAGYMQLFRPAYDAIRRYSPLIAIVTAGLAPTSNLGDAIDDRIFLQQMYDAGLADYTDIAIGAHPYGWANAPDARCCNNIADRGWDDNPHFFFIENIEATYDVMQRNGHGNLQMWVTEFGWSSWEGIPVPAPEAWHTYLTVQEQASYALQAFKIGQDLPYVGPMFLWNLNFANPTTVGRGDEIVGFSIIQPVQPPERPLFWQLRAATGADQPESQ